MAMHTITSGLAMRCGSFVRDSFSSALLKFRRPGCVPLLA
jgi:hypothetical protein